VAAGAALAVATYHLAGPWLHGHVREGAEWFPATAPGSTRM
jgi:hypothetical protein